MLSTKKLIYKICEWLTNNKLETFTGTLGSGMQDGTLTGVYDPASGIVTIQFCCRKSTDISTSQVLFSIPEKYCPSAGKNIPAAIFLNGGGTMAYRASLSTTGAITQGGSSSARGVYGGGSYTL